MNSRRIYVSSSGDTWDLVREDGTGRVTVQHRPNQASGGRTTDFELDAFLAQNRGKAESVALIEMIGTLVEKEAAQRQSGTPPAETAVITRAKQLFEEETGRAWDATFPADTGGVPPRSGEDEAAPYIERARRELDEIEEEGHS